MKIELVQDNAVVGDIEGNLAKALEWLSATPADLLVFPECFLTGYPLQDLVLRPGFLARVDAAMDHLTHAVRNKGSVGVLMGAPLAGTNLPYNAAHLIRPDGSRQVALKTELPNNDVFDERRIFARGMDPQPLDFMNLKLGVMVCEDMWHGRVARALADEGADILIVINGSPMEMGKQSIRVGHAQRRVRDTHLPLLYLNLVGGQDELVFDGGSFVLNEQGQVVAQRPFEEGSVVVEFQPTTHSIFKVGERGMGQKAHWEELVSYPNPSLVHAYPDEMEAVYRTMVMGLRDYVNKNGFSRTLLGLSGGLDSALVAALAVDALGADKLLALMLPAQWTGEESKDLSTDMAKRLGCAYKSVPVKAITNALENILDGALEGFDKSATDRAVASENFQARARGNLLMGVSNALPGTLLLSTGNKSEMSVGYATLYGDMCGGFNPIKDLYKTRVFKLCEWRNANHRNWMKGPAQPIPERIITRPPTAELAEGQTDEGKLGSYPMLDAVLECLVERLLDADAAARVASAMCGEEVSVEYANRIAGLVRRAEYKRRQAPPGIKVTARSFGFGWRYPITNKAKL